MEQLQRLYKLVAVILHNGSIGRLTNAMLQNAPEEQSLTNANYKINLSMRKLRIRLYSPKVRVQIKKCKENVLAPRI